MKIKYGKIYLPHINYTVTIKRIKPPPDSIPLARAWVQRLDKWGCNIYLGEKDSPCTVAHELIHVLQYICMDRHMTFENEFEHMAYLMQYLMGCMFGYEWIGRPKKKKVKKRCRKRS